jgi:hypothetical protein
MKTLMNILVYKRTHHGDPGPDGVFGIYDCMGAVRDRDFDAVIGVGGIGGEAEANGIAGVVNWIGVGPHKKYVGKRGPEVTFDKFVFYGGDGADLRAHAPALAKRLYDERARSILHGLDHREKMEALRIIAWAHDAPPSPALSDEVAEAELLQKCKRTWRTTC